jgi:hypothetical protein
MGSFGRDRTPQNQKSLAGELLRGRSNNLVPPLTTTKSMTANDAASKTLKKGFLNQHDGWSKVVL